MTDVQGTRGRGILHVTANVWTLIGKPTTPDEWHKVLLLPDAYEVERVNRCTCSSTSYKVTLLTYLIPADMAHVEIIPSYCLNNEEPELTKIDIVHWDGEDWVDINTDVFLGV